jgi:peptidoglycan/LPS O-acetylase OafA/YrhL
MWNPLVNVDGRALYSPPYDGHLWTIPIEYHGSIIVFLALICVAKLRPWFRLSTLICFSAYSLWATHWEIFLFLIVTLLCDVHFVRSSLPFPFFLAKIPVVARLIAAETALLATAAFSGHLLAYPDELASVTPGYHTIVSLTPHSISSANLTQRFWLSVGAAILVAAMDISPLLQAPFTTRVAQYLGRISFALYIVHGPVLYTLGMKMLFIAWPVWDEKRGSEKFALLAAGSWTVDLIVCVWAADIFWRVIDARSVKFAGWFAGKVWEKKP